MFNVRCSISDIRTLLLISFYFVATSVPAAAADDVKVTFRIEPAAVTLGEMVNATFTISGVNNPPTPTIPDIAGVRASPTPAISMNHQIINGSMSRSVSYTYRMMPTRAGAFKVGPLTYRLNGQTFNLPARTFQVAAAPTAGEQKKLEDLLFVRLGVDDDKLYVQENADLILSIYTHGLTLGNDFRIANLPTVGLTFQDFRELETGEEIVEGTVYTVRRYRTYLRGLTAGTFSLQPTLTVPIRTQKRGRSRRTLFDEFFGGRNANTERVDVLPEPLVLEIHPLPDEGKPPGFSGAVGEYTFDMKAQPRSLTAGDPITITMRLTGRGNVDAITAPALDLGADFKLYDSRLAKKELNDSRTYGWKVFEQVVIPVNDETEAIPPVRFSYFHPEKESYQTIERGPFELEIHPNTAALTRVVQAAPGLAGDGSAQVEVIDEDIVYLKSEPGGWIEAARAPWFRRTMFVAPQFAPPVLVLAVALLVRRRRSLAADQARFRRLRSSRTGTSGLRQVQAALEAKDNPAFFEALWNALAAYFGDRLNLAPGEVSQDAVAKSFSRSGMDEEGVQRIRQVFDLCEQARFGLGFAENPEMSDSDERNAAVMLEKLQNVIKQCESIRM